MKNKDFETLSPKEYILIKGAGIHNLKDLDIRYNNENEITKIEGLENLPKWY